MWIVKVREVLLEGNLSDHKYTYFEIKKKTGDGKITDRLKGTLHEHWN